MEWVLLKTIASLAAVLGLLFGFTFVIKKFFYGGSTKRTGSVEIEILGQRTLAPKRTVYVLRVMDSRLIVGVTEQGMNVLAELEKEPGADPALNSIEHGGEQFQTSQPRFLDYLSKQFGAMHWGQKGPLRKSGE